MGILEIPPAERAELATLFTNHRNLRVSVDAILQGYCGTAFANAESPFRVAQLTIGPFTFFGGDPSHPAGRNLVEGLSGFNLIVPTGDDWRDLVMEIYGNQIEIHSRLSFSSENLNLDYLRNLMAQIPDGFRVQRIDSNLATQISDKVSSDLILADVFKTPADFAERGIGFCAITGGLPVCAATSAVICDSAIEIQINTNEPYRKMGLATAVGATLIVHCLEHGIEPHWDTSDPVSEHLARKLGYLPDTNYEWLELDQ